MSVNIIESSFSSLPSVGSWFLVKSCRTSGTGTKRLSARIAVLASAIADSGCRCNPCPTLRGMMFTQQSVIASVRPPRSNSSARAKAATCRFSLRSSSAKVGDN